MGVRTIPGLLAVICAIGLAIAGMGWWSGEKPKQPMPKVVYCDIDELIKYHPAWNQAGFTELELTPINNWNRAMDIPALDLPTLVGKEPSVKSSTRKELQTRLEAKTLEELKRASDNLSISLERQLLERQRELEAEANASEAEARRESDQELANGLRVLSESRLHELVDASVKLAAAKAKLKAAGIDKTKAEQTIRDREISLAGLQAAMAADEQSLRNEIEAKVENAGNARREKISAELQRLRVQGDKRIDSYIRSGRERLSRDLNAEGSSRLEDISSGQPGLPSVGNGVTARAALARTRALSAFNTSSASIGQSDHYRKDLRARIKHEIEIEINRIACENGLTVTFDPGRNAEDKTEWFRARLPFEGMGKSS